MTEILQFRTQAGVQSPAPAGTRRDAAVHAVRPGSPNAFVVGAARCGTTSLYEYLRAHPQVFAPAAIKELGYFADAGIVRDAASYAAFFAEPRAMAARLRLDVSTAYLWHPASAVRIRDACGLDVRIVAILRDPSAAALSLWKYQRSLGREPLDFPAALAAEAGRRAAPRDLPEWVPNYFYVDRYRYAPQLHRYLEVFGRDRVHVLLFEDMFADAATHWAALCRFLGIEPSPPANLGRAFNADRGRIGAPRSEALRRFLAAPRNPWRKAAGALLPYPARERLLRLLTGLNARAARDPQAEAEHRAALRPCFADDIAETSALLGRDLTRVWNR